MNGIKTVIFGACAYLNFTRETAVKFIIKRRHLWRTETVLNFITYNLIAPKATTL